MILADPARIVTKVARKLKVLAVASADRLRDAPQYPTLAETYPGFDVSAFQAIMVPSRVPTAAIDKLSVDIDSVVSLAEFADKVAQMRAGGRPAEGRLK